MKITSQHTSIIKYQLFKAGYLVLSRTGSLVMFGRYKVKVLTIPGHLNLQLIMTFFNSLARELMLLPHIMSLFRTGSHSCHMSNPPVNQRTPASAPSHFLLQLILLQSIHLVSHLTAQSRTMNCSVSSGRAALDPLSLDIQMLAAMAAVMFSFLSLFPANAISDPSKFRSLHDRKLVGQQYSFYCSSLAS